MASTSLFDGYLADRPQNRQTMLQRRNGSLASLSAYSLDESSTSSHSPAPSASSASRIMRDSELQQQQQHLRPMDEDEEDARQDDDNTVVGSEEQDDLSGGRGAGSSGSAQPTPTPSTVTFSDALSKQGSSSSSRARNVQTRRTAPAPLNSAQRFRHIPRLPNHHTDRLAPSTVPYWSKAPVYGALPTRCMRAHTITLIENIAWQIGGCDDKACSNEVLTFDTETMQWAHPETTGDVPPPRRAHSATQVDRRIFIFGGGEAAKYYDHLYVLDTVLRRWNRITFPPDAAGPIPRRAHATWYYQGKVYLFGGGNGTRALNDLWTFEVGIGPPYDHIRWVELEVQGIRPSPRGYHTANLVNNSVVIIGGSDGSACFEDVWILNLERLTWHEVKLEVPTKRLSHTSTHVGSYLFVMGGHDGTKYNHDLLLFNLVTLQWEKRETCGRYPTSRGYHATILADSRLFVIGGFDGHTVFDDVYILDLAAAAYLPQIKSFDLTPN